MRNYAMEPATILIHLPPSPRLLLHLIAYGDPESVRKALRKACSRRRSIIALRPAIFVVNFIKALSTYGQDLLGSYEPGSDRGDLLYSYEIDVERSTPYILISPRDGEPERMPVFEFIGTERTRMIQKDRVLSGKKLGRPTNLSRVLAAKQLENELQKAEDNRFKEPEFESIPVVELGKEIWRETLRERTREKGRRLGKRLVRVDFDLMQKPEED